MKHLVTIIFLWSIIFGWNVISLNFSTLPGCHSNEVSRDYEIAKNEINLSKYYLDIDLDSAQAIWPCSNMNTQWTKFNLNDPSWKNVWFIKIYENQPTIKIIWSIEDYKKTTIGRIGWYISYVLSIFYKNLWYVFLFVFMIIFLMYRKYTRNKKPKN